jgi:hypothetical protein
MWEDGWFDRVDQWAAAQGLQAIDIVPNSYFKPAGYHIINGKSPRGDFDHSIIGLKGQPVHDPHPGGNCRLESIESYTMFVIIQ